MDDTILSHIRMDVCYRCWSHDVVGRRISQEPHLLVNCTFAPHARKFDIAPLDCPQRVILAVNFLWSTSPSHLTCSLVILLRRTGETSMLLWWPCHISIALNRVLIEDRVPYDRTQQARRPYRGDNPDVIRHGHVDFRSSESFCSRPLICGSPPASCDFFSFRGRATGFTIISGQSGGYSSSVPICYLAYCVQYGSCRLADNVYSARAAGGVNYFSVISVTTSMPVLCCSYAFLFHLVVFLQILACISPRSLLRPVSLHLVVLPSDLMYIPAQPVAPSCCAMYVPCRLADSVYSSRAAGGVNDLLSVMSTTISRPEL
ncbi:uncharacterized protein ARMOST_02259 [Armillaria ostoyae]|uniref:Uncharacterized protein n=1 Tax=Armillaria ostoyae TaxID=47428 RepID=A0A284QR86_ARMOS|nr:uncharacterized protein ARMOST_02259 [Armillaria ostoyae]